MSKQETMLEGAKCKACGASIRFKLTKNGIPTPVDWDDTPHWATCTKPEQFRKPRS